MRTYVVKVVSVSGDIPRIAIINHMCVIMTYVGWDINDGDETNVHTQYRQIYDAAMLYIHWKLQLSMRLLVAAVTI